MIKDFPKEVYGLSLRLVEISDASDIVQLRSSPELTKYMITVEQDVEKQKEWIKEYKKREQCGEDLYFAYQREDQLAGFARISHINYEKENCTLSSWIKNPVVNGVGSCMLLSRFDIAFEYLNLNEVYASIHKDNKKAMKHWQYFNCTIEEKSNGYYSVRVSMKDFYNNKNSYSKKFINF